MARKRKNKLVLKDYQYRALMLLKPPESLTVSQWAEKYRMLDSKTSAMPGRWRNEQTPYLKDIMDELNNYETEEIIFVKPTQVGGTEALQNMLGWVISQDPSPTMVVYPTEALAKSVSENRIEPMIYSSEALKTRYRKGQSEKLELQFDGMYLTLTGSNSPTSLASKAIKYLFIDEVDKFPGASGREADPVSLAKERTKTFHNSKVFITSTPTVKSNHIWRYKESADMEKHYFVPCPHCGEYIELKMDNVRFPSGTSIAERAEGAYYVCEECGGVINDSQKDMMIKKGIWRTVKKNTEHKRSVCYWMNTLYSPFVRFSDAVRSFLYSKNDPELLQNFINSWLAEPWEDARLKTDADLVMNRQTNVEGGIVPMWAKFLTAGVDVQLNSLYWSIRAWGDHITSQNIAHGQALSFADIERVMNNVYPIEGGGEMPVSLVLVDSGNDTDRVYSFCANNQEWAVPVKGSSHEMLSHYKISRVNKAASAANGMNLIIVDTLKYKDMIAGRMQKTVGEGAWMVYSDCDRRYAEMVTSEQKVYEKGRYYWKPKKAGADNHWLDCEVYAMAAADIMGVRTLHLEYEPPKTKKEMREEKRAEEASEFQWIEANEEWI